MIGFTSSGSTDSTEKFLQSMKDQTIYDSLAKYGQEGVNALASATPKDSGITADSWTYEIIKDSRSWSIVWGNTNVVNGTPVAILIQMGHGTGTGGFVQGVDFINPALQPIFDRMANEAWKAVTAR